MKSSTPLHPPRASRDPLLRITLVILRVAQIICALAFALVVVFFLVSFVKPAFFEHVLLTGSFGSTPLGVVITGVAGAAGVLLSLLLVGHLIKIAQSVGDGTPFITENADRLHKIAYLSVGLLVADIAITGVAYFSTGRTRAYIDWTVFDPANIITILALFILARVFQEGVRLNDEAQFTV